MPRQTLKKRADGRYVCKYNGKFFYGKTQGEALAARDEYKRSEREHSAIQVQGVTVEDYAAKWVHAYKAHLTDAPYNTHVRNLNRFCESVGKNKPIADITTLDIQKFYNQYIGASFSSIRSVRDTVKGLFSGALADRIIDYDPSLKATIPKGAKGTHRAITQEERELIHKTQHRMRLAALVMLYAGLRRGEAMAINIDTDVDFASHTISVSKAVRFEGSNMHPALVFPKTKSGIRTIPMVSPLEAELRGHHGLLIPSSSGELMTESAWSRCWESYLVALSETYNGCSKRWYGKKKSDKDNPPPAWRSIVIRPHDLRHSYCTMLYDAGVDLRRAMAWMGHSDASMTQQIYTHLTQINQNRATTALENMAKILSGSQNGSQNEQPPKKE